MIPLSSTPLSADTKQTALAQLVVSLVSLFIGFQIGVRTRWSRSLTDAQYQVSEEREACATTTVTETRQDSNHDPETEEVVDGNLASIQPKLAEQCKLVLVVRTDLSMSAGDVSAQCASATLACYKALVAKNPKLVRHWEVTGQAKIALKGKSEEQLLELEAIAKSLNLCARTMHDENLTAGHEGTRTVLGIGPAPIDIVNQVTGKLRLL